MQRKFPKIVFYRMPGIGTTLKTHDNIRMLRKHVSNLAFSLISEKKG